MSWEAYNPNPYGIRVGDCVIRAICAAMDMDWDEAYTSLSLEGYVMGDMPSSNAVWGAYLKRNGFVQETIPKTCPNCYTLSDFAHDYPNGVYVVALDGHVATVKDGVIYDSWDSSNEIPLYFWQSTDREEKTDEERS